MASKKKRSKKKTGALDTVKKAIRNLFKSKPKKKTRSKAKKKPRKR